MEDSLVAGRDAVGHGGLREPQAESGAREVTAEDGPGRGKRLRSGPTDRNR
jgi:hypothetical protein